MDLFSAGLEFLLEMYSACFHPRHSLLLTVKRHLIYIYGRGPDSCAPEQLAAKLEYCDQLLAVLDTLMPGLTRCNVTVMSGLRCHVMVMSSCHETFMSPGSEASHCTSGLWPPCRLPLTIQR